VGFIGKLEMKRLLGRPVPWMVHQVVGIAMGIVFCLWFVGADIAEFYYLWLTSLAIIGTYIAWILAAALFGGERTELKPPESSDNDHRDVPPSTGNHVGFTRSD
jgi:hypothetical protein